MKKLLFISDPHITAPGHTIIGLDPKARMKAVLDAAVADHPDATALILLGDLTHDGSAAAYRVLAELLADVPMPVIPMMGNHDNRETFLTQFPDAPQTASGHIQTVLDIGHHRIITLDSLDGPPYAPDHHAGRLCPDRRAFLQDALDGRDGRHVLVCIHHPPFDTGIRGMDRIKLADGDSMLDQLAAAGQVHLICGHIHRNMSGSTRGVPWSMFKSPCHQGPIDLASPNSHLSVDEPGAYGLALLGDDGVIVHTQDVGLPSGQVHPGYDAGG